MEIVRVPAAKINRQTQKKNPADASIRGVN
jgi:hypothetical protein